MSLDTSMRVKDLSESQRARLRDALATRSHGPSATGEFDVAVLGGGTAGLTLALQLVRARPGVKVVLLERTAFPVPQTTHKVGESTVEIAAHYLRDVLGMADHLQAEQLRKFGLRMFFSAGANQDIAERFEVGSSVFPPLCTYQLDRGRLENELARRCVEAGVTMVEAQLGSVSAAPDGPHVVEYTQAGERRSTSATWLVDATGRSQVLRRAQGARRPRNEHSASAAWLRIAHPVDVNRWSDDPEWAARIPLGDRAMSTNHLMGPGRWVWIIRLSSGSTSIGIVADDAAHDFSDFNTLERALGWLDVHEPQLAADLRRHQDKIQDFRVMRDYSYGCEAVYDGAARWCLTGESGLFLDPLYSPGLDLIAISNGLVADLVLRSLDGEDVTARARIHDRLYRTVADIWLAIYRGQYVLMGNARVMSTKVIWDTAFYWGVFGALFFSDKFRDLTQVPTVTRDLARLTQISNRMQQFFREWHAIDAGSPGRRFVDLYSPLDFMVELHGRMGDHLDGPEFAARFTENTRLLSQVAGQLVSAVTAHFAASSFDDDVVRTVQAWQRDPVLTDLVAVHRRDSRSSPTSSQWFVLEDDPALAHPAAPREWDRHDTLDTSVVPA